MKLLLLESVEGLGRPGDQVDVKPGFARNFLIPTDKAVRVNSDTLRMLGRLKAKADEEERAMVSSMDQLASKIAGFQVEVRARATDEGHLFGSVTEKDVAAALQAAGWDVDVRQVRMEAHLKEAGVTEVELHLYGEIRSLVKVVVTAVDLDGMAIELEPEEDEADDGDDEATGSEGVDDAAKAAAEA